MKMPYTVDTKSNSWYWGDIKAECLVLTFLWCNINSGNWSRAAASDAASESVLNSKIFSCRPTPFSPTDQSQRQLQEGILLLLLTIDYNVFICVLMLCVSTKKQLPGEISYRLAGLAFKLIFKESGRTAANRINGRVNWSDMQQRGNCGYAWGRLYHLANSGLCQIVAEKNN